MPLADPGYISDVVAGGALDPDWGNAIRDRVIHHFANATDRDANITSPTEGMACWLADVDQYLIYNGVAWRQPWNMAWGEVVYAEITGAVTGIGTPGVYGDVTGLSVTFTAIAHRIYVVHAEGGNTQQNTSTGLAKIVITDGANVIKRDCFNRTMVATERNSWGGEVRLGSLSAGTQTFKVRAQTSVGTIDINANTTDPGPSFITVRDWGPNGTAA